LITSAHRCGYKSGNCERASQQAHVDLLRDPTIGIIAMLLGCFSHYQSIHLDLV